MTFVGNQADSSRFKLCLHKEAKFDRKRINTCLSGAFFIQLLFLHLIRLASRPSSYRITFISLHFFCWSFRSNTHLNNAIKRCLYRYRSPRFRLSGDVDRSHRLRRGGLHWHSGREFHIVGSRMFQFGKWLDEVIQLFWCPQPNRILRYRW